VAQTDPDHRLDHAATDPGASAAPSASSSAPQTPYLAGAPASPATAGAPHVTGAPTALGAVGVDPLTAPVTYPGTPPWRPAVLVTDAAVLALQPRRDTPLGEWLLQAAAVGTPLRPIAQDPLLRDATPADVAASETLTGEIQTRALTADRSDARKAAEGPELQELDLDRYLRDAGGPPVAALVPVLAVGSNASPAQLRRKLATAGLPTLVPITSVRVSGLAVGVSAHVSRPGYLPATPVPDDDAVSDLWVVWLGAAALAAVDATEPNYERIRLPTRYPVRLTTGQPVTQCWVYLSRHGYLINEAGEPRRLTDQATLISGLLAGIPALRTLAGASPQEWIERTRDPADRDAIREILRSAGLVHATAGL
jgi:hypothetical protein